MKELFGAPMSDVLQVVVVLLIIAGLLLAVLAWRHPLLFKLGIRNVPRRPAQTALIVIGLMLSTLLISSAFATGDTLSSSLRNFAFEITGPIDHVIQFDNEGGRSVQQREAGVPQEVADDLRAAFADVPDIEQFTRVLFDAVSVENVTRDQFSPVIFTLGLDPAEVDALGGIPALGGDRNILLTDLQEGDIVLNESAAKELAAEIDDTVRLRVLGAFHSFQVYDIAEDTLLSGKVDPGEPQGAVIHLEDAQAIFDQPGRLTGIGVSAGGIGPSDKVDAALNAFLDEQAAREVQTGVPAAERLYADTLGRPQFESIAFKADTVEDAETFGSIFTSFFLVMGSFAIVAGLLLILLIFIMLAEERKTEMGISRAVGMQRGQLVQAYLAEGLAYNLGAAAIGTVAGIFVSFGMVAVLESAFDDFGFTFAQHIEPRSVVVAAGLGILLTLITVVISAFRVSQLNIVAAIRDLPEEGGRRRRISPLGLITTPVGLILLPIVPLNVALAVVGFLLLNVPRLGSAIRRRGWGEWVVIPIWRLMRWRQEWWLVALLAGVFGILRGLDSESSFLYLLGLSLIPIGLTLLARRFNRAGRLAYSLMGLSILFFWLAPEDWHIAVTGVETEGDIEMFFLSGVMMVTGTTVFVIFNLDLLVLPIRLFGRLFGRFGPAVQTAVAYPTTARFRTGMTVAMIAIIMFALVTFTTINKNFAEAFTSDAAAGGFDVQADTTINDDIPDLGAALQAAGAGAVAADLEETSRLQIGSVLGTDVRLLESERWDSLHDRPIRDATGAPIVDRAADADDPEASQLVFLTGADDAFLRLNRVPLQARAAGFESDEAVWQALRDPTQRYAVVTYNAVATDDFSDTEDESFQMPDVIDESSTRNPRVLVDLRNGEQTAEVTIIGVVDQVALVTAPEFPFLPSIVVRDDVVQQLYAEADWTRHLARVGPGANPLETARAIEAALGVQSVSIIDELKDQQSQFNAILKLFQGFTGLGLVVGIAALGVIAVRSVVERRQQIGVLRAIGYRRSMVRLELMLEMGFIALLGIGVGVALSIVLAWRLFDEGVFGSTGGLGFQVPVGQIVIFSAAALVGALLFTYLPARQAARMPIAQALRYE